MTVQPITTFQEFTNLANHVVTTDRAVIVSVGEDTKVAIVPVVEYESIQSKRQKAKSELITLMDEMHQKNANLDPDEVDEEIFKATMEVRYGKAPTQ